MWRALLSTDEGFAVIKYVVMQFWDSEVMPEEWEVGLLKILPKKGDLSLAGNYRGIMLLEVAYKIVANLLRMQLNKIVESPAHLDHESRSP